MSGILISSTYSFQFLYGAIHSFGLAVVCSRNDGISDTNEVSFEHECYCVHFFDIVTSGIIEPVIELSISIHRSIIVELNQTSEEFFDFPCLNDFQIHFTQLFHSATVICSVLGFILQPQVFRPFQFAVVKDFTFTNLVYSFVQISNTVIEVMAM